jgi:hypothetical protein
MRHDTARDSPALGDFFEADCGAPALSRAYWPMLVLPFLLSDLLAEVPFITEFPNLVQLRF